MKCLFSERVKELRLERKLNQKSFAEKLGVKQSCVSKWERGETLPDAEMIMGIVEFFNVSADYLLGIKDY